MATIITEVDVAVPPDRVWQILMDFERYREWHPFIELKGVAVEGGEVAYTLRKNPRRRDVAADFVGGRVDIAFRPYAGRIRAVLNVRCQRGSCAGFRDPELLVPIGNAPPLRVRFRRADGQLISTTAFASLPPEQAVVHAGWSRHTVQVR